MPRKKREHFAQMKEWGHVIEPQRVWGTGGRGVTQDLAVKSNLPGTWGSRVILELACGGGDYALELARCWPEATVVGVDIKGARLWHGAWRGLERGLQNLRFLRVRIEELAEHFASSEVDEIWITFPDPHPTLGNAKRRLTSPRFLDIYKRILKPGGRLHLKTDNEGLFEYSVETLRAAGFEELRIVSDLYGADFVDDFLQGVQTAYEKKYLKEGRKIRYGEWRV